ncbi:hypothetical protein LOD99_854 [Oopsacas minuta]|uniref:Uncharacterized protein n=1 Tax=Oopsacas minuta TaxID=111878 RepID=A0AAV7K0J2_9METZ|nr:hypothetical protein LOD99_854 [Oopsacas minuta]
MILQKANSPQFGSDSANLKSGRDAITLLQIHIATFQIQEDSFVKRKRAEIEVHQPEATQEFEVEDLIIKHPEHMNSPNPKRAKTAMNVSMEGAPDIAQNLPEDPRQLKLITYIQIMLDGQMRCFHKGWYIGRHRLEYSQIIDAMFLGYFR